MPEHPVGPRGHPALFRGIVVVGEKVVLVRGRKVNRALGEALEHVARFMLDLKIANYEPCLDISRPRPR